MQKSQLRGFTLMELMITIAIVGIIAALALPSYRQYVVRNNRVAVQAEMMQIANSLERFRSQQLTYANASLLSLYGKSQYPQTTGKALYLLDLQVVNGTTWVLLATPASEGKVQVGDGALKINNAGQRCWNKASDTDCTLGAADQSWTSK